MEIQKKTKPIPVIILVLLSLGAVSLWVLFQFLFPLLQGFMKFKIAVVGVIVGLILWAIYVTIKHQSKKGPGLIIADGGVTDNTGMESVGFIPWGDITEVKEAQDLFKRKVIVLMVENPDSYIYKTNKMAEARKNNHKMFGSPIVINAKTLETEHQTLLSTLKERAGR